MKKITRLLVAAFILEMLAACSTTSTGYLPPTDGAVWEQTSATDGEFALDYRLYVGGRRIMQKAIYFKKHRMSEEITRLTKEHDFRMHIYDQCVDNIAVEGRDYGVIATLLIKEITDKDISFNILYSRTGPSATTRLNETIKVEVTKEAHKILRGDMLWVSRWRKLSKQAPHVAHQSRGGTGGTGVSPQE